MTSIIDEYYEKIRQEKEYAANLFKAQKDVEKMLDDYTMTLGVLEQKPEQQLLYNEYSGSDRVLEYALQNLNRSLALGKLDPDTPNITSLPLESVMEIIDKKTSEVQKKTAFRVLQRYFKNTKMQDAET